MRPIKNYATFIMTFFTPLIFVKLSQFYSITSPVLFTKNKKLWNDRNKDFLHIWVFQRITLYQRK